MNRNCRRKIEKIYVKVNSDFDATGYMQPRQITWGDGRAYPIEQVRVKCSESNRIETSVLPAGHHYIPVELDEVVFFLRKGHLLPLAKDGKKIQSVADVDFADLRLLAYAPDGASYEYYTDDGETKDYDKPEHFVHITLDADGNAKSDRAAVKVEG